MWHELVYEIIARGWRAFAYGPEFWLAFPAALTLIFVWAIRRKK